MTRLEKWFTSTTRWARFHKVSLKDLLTFLCFEVGQAAPHNGEPLLCSKQGSWSALLLAIASKVGVCVDLSLFSFILSFHIPQSSPPLCRFLMFFIISFWELMESQFPKSEAYNLKYRKTIENSSEIKLIGMENKLQRAIMGGHENGSLVDIPYGAYLIKAIIKLTLFSLS